MNLAKFTGSGSTPSRRRFWDQVADVVIASQKVEGKNVSVDERQGGTVININRNAGQLTGACCVGTDCSITTEAACDDLGGTYQGNGTVCDPNPCCECVCSGTGTPIPCHVSGEITLNCDCEEFCGVSSHIEMVDDNLIGDGCSCFISFSYDFECDEACTPCHIVGGINVAFDFGMSQWNILVNYSYSNSAFVVLCSFSVTVPFDFSSGDPVTIDQDVPNGIPGPDCVSHINLTIS